VGVKWWGWGLQCALTTVPCSRPSACFMHACPTVCLCVSVYLCARVCTARACVHGEHSSCASPCNHRSDKGIGRNRRCPVRAPFALRIVPSSTHSVCSVHEVSLVHTQSCSLFLSPALTHGVPSRDRIALASAGPVHGVVEHSQAMCRAPDGGRSAMWVLR
jgi:hypothetical protein